MPSDKLTVQVHVTVDDVAKALIDAQVLLQKSIAEMEQRMAALEQLPGVQEALGKGERDGDPQASPKAQGEGATEAPTS